MLKWLRRQGEQEIKATATNEGNPDTEENARVGLRCEVQYHQLGSWYQATIIACAGNFLVECANTRQLTLLLMLSILYTIFFSVGSDGVEKCSVEYDDGDSERDVEIQYMRSIGTGKPLVCSNTGANSPSPSPPPAAVAAAADGDGDGEDSDDRSAIELADINESKVEEEQVVIENAVSSKCTVDINADEIIADNSKCENEEITRKGYESSNVTAAIENSLELPMYEEEEDSASVVESKSDSSDNIKTTDGNFVAEIGEYPDEEEKDVVDRDDNFESDEEIADVVEISEGKEEITDLVEISEGKEDIPDVDAISESKPEILDDEEEEVQEQNYSDSGFDEYEESFNSISEVTSEKQLEEEKLADLAIHMHVSQDQSKCYCYYFSFCSRSI